MASQSGSATPSAGAKAAKVKSLLASYYTAEQDDEPSNRIDDTPLQ